MNTSTDRLLLFGGAVLFLIVLCIALLYPESNENTQSNSSIQDSSNMDYTKYVELGDYKNIDTGITRKEVSIVDIEDEYKNVLRSYGTFYVEDKDGKVDQGDLVSIEYTMGETTGPFSMQGVIGNNEFPEEMENAMAQAMLGDTVTAKLSEESTEEYKITIVDIDVLGDATDEQIAALGIDNISTVNDLKKEIENHLSEEKENEYRVEKTNKIKEICFENSTFTDMPSDYIAPFKEVLRTLLDTTLESYKETDENATIDDVLKETYEKDNISNVDEYLDKYGLQNAQTYAMVQKIAQAENIKTEELDVYSLAAADWLQVTDQYPTFKEYVSDTDIFLYEYTALSNKVFDYLYEINEQGAE